MTFIPPMAAPLPGAPVRIARTVRPPALVASTCSGESCLKPLFCSGSPARRSARNGVRIRGSARVEFAGIRAGDRRDLRRQQAQDHAVLVRGPHRAVAAQKRRACAFLAAEAERAVEQPVDEPFESDRDFDEAAAQPRATRSIMPLLTTVLPTAAASTTRVDARTGTKSPPPGSDWDSSVPPSA